MRLRACLPVFRSAGKGLLIGVLVVFGALFAYSLVVPLWIPWVSAAPAMRNAMIVHGLLTLWFLVRRDWGVAVGLWLTWPFLVALRLWIIPAYEEARNFVVHYERFYARDVAAPSQPIRALTILLGRTECESECARALRDELGLDYLGIVNVRLGARNSQVEATPDGIRGCEEPERPFETIRGRPGRPLEFIRTPTDCLFREQWSLRVPRVDVFYYAPSEPPYPATPGAQYLLVEEFTEAAPNRRVLAHWTVGRFPDERSYRHLHGTPFTLDDVLSQLFAREVAMDRRAQAASSPAPNRP